MSQSLRMHGNVRKDRHGQQYLYARGRSLRDLEHQVQRWTRAGQVIDKKRKGLRSTIWKRRSS